MFYHRRILALLERLLAEVRAIRYALTRPVDIEIKFGKGDLPMPVTMKVGQTVTAAPVETDATGASVAITDPAQIQWTSSDPAIASAAPVDNSGGTVFTAVAPGSVTVTVTDPANGLTAGDSITVEAVVPPATAIAIEFGTPTP